MSVAGVDWVTALFRHLGPQYLADFMRRTGNDLLTDPEALLSHYLLGNCNE